MNLANSLRGAPPPSKGGAITWASAWLSFTLGLLMRPDGRSCSCSAGWMRRC